MSVELIGTRITQASSGTTLAVPFPTVASGATREVAAGDVVVLVIGSNYAPTTSPPAGWTMLQNSAGTNIGGAVLRKTLTSSDVTAGSATVSFGGSEPMTAVALAFAPGAYVDVDAFQTSGSGSAQSNPVDAFTGDRAYYFAFERGSGMTTISRGTTIATATTSPTLKVNAEQGPIAVDSTVTYTPPAAVARYEVTLIVTEDAAIGTRSFADEVTYDAPWGWWRSSDSAGPLADSSPNGRSMALSGTAPTFGVTAFRSGEKGIAWPAQNAYATTSPVTFNPGAGWTYEAWVYLSELPASQAAILSAADYDSGTFYVDTFLSIRTDGKPTMGQWNGSWTELVAPSALTLNTWHHIAATVTVRGAMALHVDGVPVEAGTRTPTSSDRQMRLRGGHSPSSGTPANGAVTISNAVVYARALRSARVRARYVSGLAVAAPAMTLAATVRPKVASFALATVAAVTLAATVQPKTASFTMDAPPNTRSVELAATVQPKTASFTLATEAAVSLAATVQPKVAQFSITSADRAMMLAATVRRKTAAFALVAPPFLKLFATVQPKIATFTARAITPVTPAPETVDQAMSAVVAQAFGPVTMHGAQPVYAVSEAMIARGRQQIIVNGRDVTYFRDVVTPDVEYTLLEPLLYGPGSIEFPQISACFETEGAGELAWLRAQAPVEVNLVVDDVVVAPLYKGFVAAFDKSGRTLTVQLGGEANGRAAMRDRQVPIFPRINDVGHQLADAVRDLGLPHYPPLGAVTGIETMTTGGTGHLDHINNLVAKSWTRSGKQWTVMPDPATGVYETHRKDAATIHASAFLDDEKTRATLRRDIAEEPNQIFVTCVTPAGMRVRFGKYPGLVQGPVPDFPGSMFLGDSGEGVRLLIGKLHASGYLRLSEVAGGYDDDVMRAVMQLQDDAGLPETGEVNEATWRALYDLDVTGLSLEWANIQPAAQRSKTRKFNRSANGTIMGFNDEYDPDVIVRHRTIDLGAGVTRKQAREYAKTVLHDSDDANWVGDITFNAGALIRGEASIGATLTAADVMDARELRPGMNLWLPAFDGGTLMHVSACQVSRDGIVTATVDTRARDAMEVWEVIARNRESRNDPSRQRERRFRASTIAKDSIGEWDEFGGMLGVDLPLERGWNKFPVIAAMEGQIHKLKIVLDTPAEFAVAVWGEDPDVGWLNENMPHPLTVSGTKAWETKGDALDDRLLLYSAGTHDEPCGYFPGRKKWKSVTGEEANPDYAPAADDNDTGTDDQETVEVTTQESYGTLTGKFVDEAGFRYFAADRKVVWVTVFVRAENKIPLGRVMWPQLEAGV